MFYSTDGKTLTWKFKIQLLDLLSRPKLWTHFLTACIHNLKSSASSYTYNLKTYSQLYKISQSRINNYVLSWHMHRGGRGFRRSNEEEEPGRYERMNHSRLRNVHTQSFPPYTSKWRPWQISKIWSISPWAHRRLWTSKHCRSCC